MFYNISYKISLNIVNKHLEANKEAKQAIDFAASSFERLAWKNINQKIWLRDGEKSQPNSYFTNAVDSLTIEKQSNKLRNMNSATQW